MVSILDPMTTYTMDNQQRKNSSGAIFARKSFVCVVTNALPGLQKRVLKRDFFLNVLLVLVRTFINELSKKYGTVKFDLRASLKFGFE